MGNSRVDVLGSPRRYSGVVTKWIESSGFGFADINDTNVFLHISKFNGYDTGGPMPVRVGSIIEAGIISAVKGRQAVAVEVKVY